MVFNPYWFGFVVLKLVYMLVAILIVSVHIKLGDTFRYLEASGLFTVDVFLYSSLMMDFFAGNLSKLLGDLGANIPFLVLSAYGIYYSVSRLNLNNRQLLIILLLLSFPSFGIWTSIASKEAIGVFYLGIIGGFIVDYIKRNPKKNYLLVGFAFYLCTIFKPQYLMGIFALLLFVFLCQKTSLKAEGKSVVFLLFFVFSFLVLYLARNEINELSFIMPAHFSLEAGSTRENTIWVNDFDVFWNAPYGMFIGFFGPTISEVLSKPTHLIAFLESAIIVGLFIYGIVKLILVSVNTGRVNVFYLGVFITATLWILFVHYPFGALNPGSAIRYRENFYGFLVILFYFSYIQVKRNYVSFKINKNQLQRNLS